MQPSLSLFCFVVNRVTVTAPDPGRLPTTLTYAFLCTSRYCAVKDAGLVQKKKSTIPRWANILESPQRLLSSALPSAQSQQAHFYSAPVGGGATVQLGQCKRDRLNRVARDHAQREERERRGNRRGTSTSHIREAQENDYFLPIMTSCRYTGHCSLAARTSSVTMCSWGASCAVNQ